MTTNSNMDAGLGHAHMGQQVVPPNDYAGPFDTNNKAEGEPQMNAPETNHSVTAMSAPVATVALPSIADGSDGSDDWSTTDEIGPANRLGKVVPILAGQKAHQVHPPTSGTPFDSQRAVSPKSGAAAKAKSIPNVLSADGKEKDSDRLIRLAEPAFLFHNHDQEAFASVEVERGEETWAVRSNNFKHWLTHQFFMDSQGAPSANAMKEAIGVLEAKAKFVGPTIRVFTRVAEHEGNVYIDLADEDRTVVEITPAGWGLVDDAPVKFRRAKGMRALPAPVADGSIDELRPFLNVHDETDWMLIVAWLLAALRPHGPYPLAALHGEHGSAKTTTARVLRALVDPNLAPVRSEPKDGRDLMIAAINGWMIVLDNLSKVADSLSDALCRLSTGGGLGTRKLHTDTDETILDAQRPVILTGIEELATRGDLLDRSLVINLPAIHSSERKTERQFWAEFGEAQPRILGALLTVVAGALREEPSVDLLHLPRMADFAVWISAAEPGLGWERGAFMKAFIENRHRANEVALETSFLTTPVLKLIERGPWTGTAEQLLHLLEPTVPDSVRRNPEWPKTARGLAGALRRLNPNLRPLGVEISFDRDNGRQRTRVITIARQAPSGPSAPSGSVGAPAR